MSPPTQAVDKSGVTPNTISLPSGPGSIEGLGESFQPNLNTGTAKYRVNFTVAPGTAGNAPELALSYDGGGSNGPFGFGWGIDIPFVQRQTDKGIPRYVDAINGLDDDGDGEFDEADEIDRFINHMREELVNTSDGYYFSETEGTFIRYRRVAGHWEANLPDGTLLEFGLTPNARITDPDTGHIFCWMLEQQTDTNGNVISYGYKTYPGDENKNRLYLSKIEYGPGSPPWENFHFVVFQYESRLDWFEDCRSGFIIRTGKRLKEVIIGTQGPDIPGHASGDFNNDGKTDHLNRKYRLAYNAHSHWSLLTSVTWIGADSVSEFPAIGFGYTTADPPDTLAIGDNAIGSKNTPIQVLDNDLVDLLDLNGDALPDMLKTEMFGGPHTAYLNQGEIEENGLRVIQWSAGKNMEGDPLAWNVNLADSTGAIAHLADMDADGLADLVYTSVSGVYYFSNQGNVSWGPRTQMNEDPMSASPPSPFGSQDARTADLDFDKHMDIIQSISVGTGADYRVWFNMGDQKYSRSMTISQDSGVMFSYSGVQIADFNGDRMPDIVQIRPTGIQVTAGLGYGHFAPMVFVPLPDDTFDEQMIQKSRLQDITGDGLTDLVIERPVPGQLWYWINLGNYTLDKRRTLTGMPTVYGTDPEIRWADMNGNGTTDLVYSDQYANPRIQTIDIGRLIGCVPAPNMLNRIDNGIGQKTIIEYTTSTQFMLNDTASEHPWSVPLPFPVNVINRVTVDDSLGNRYMTTYQYHDGYYDGEEKEFRGFASVEQREIGDSTIPDLITGFTFDTGVHVKALKGKILQTETRNTQDEVFYREQNTWMARILYNSVIDDGEVIFPYQSERTRHIIEKGTGTPVQLKWEYEYDHYGNMTRQVEQGRMEDGWDDERITESTYTAGYESGREKWILNAEVEMKITDENGTQASHKRSFYDGSLNPGEVSKGNLTRVESWVSEDRYVVSARNDYDAYGNITAIYDPIYGSESGHYRNIAYDDAFHAYPVREVIYTGNDELQSLILSVTYDAGFGMVVSSTDFNGFATSYAYDAFGRLISLTLPPDTGHTKEYEYMLAHPLGDGKIINWVETREKDGSADDGFLRSREFYDGLSRKIMTRAEGETIGQIVVTDTVEFNVRQSVWKKYLPYFDIGTLDYSEPTHDSGFTEYLYDALEREIRVNQPAGLEGIVYSTTQYTPLTRLVRDEEQNNPASAHFGCGIRYVEDGLLNEEESGRLREVYEIVKLSDAGEPLDETTEWCTRYTWDLLDNFTGYTDAQSNRKMIEYDGFARMIFINDPDSGQKDFIYDDANNLIRTEDAKGQVIRYAYDGVNRMTSEYYGRDTTEPAVTYHYDLPFGPVDRGDFRGRDISEDITQSILNDVYFPEHDLNSDGKIDVADVVKASRNTNPENSITAQNTKGRLSWVEDRSGEEHHSFDARGRVTWTVKRIFDTDMKSLRNFYTGMDYDAMDRTTHLVYPDGTLSTFIYNNRGLLESIPNVIDRYDYNPAGQNAAMTLTCEIDVTRDYDHRHRLSRLKAVRSNDHLSIQDLNYTYDFVSNLTQIKDDRNNQVFDAIGQEIGISPEKVRGFNASQSFAYDSLYRLIWAANPSVYGTITYRYDRIGNISMKNADLIVVDPSMDLGKITSGGKQGVWNREGRNPGDEPGPHALTLIEKGSVSLAYDDNGNVIMDNETAYTWDHKDRLTRVTDETIRADYLYDYKGDRKRKIVTQGNEASVVFYIDNFSELRNGKLLKYVYAGTNRIALSDASPQTAAEFSPSAFFLHDHLGSTALSVSNDAQIKEMIVNYPYGMPRREYRQLLYTFAGKEYDREIGLHYFDARYLRGSTGDFISVDPMMISEPQQFINMPRLLNPYAYTARNPLLYKDDSGEWLINALAGALVSAAIEVGIQAASSYIEKGKVEIEWKKVGLEAATGAISGGVSAINKVKQLSKFASTGLKVLKHSANFAKEYYKMKPDERSLGEAIAKTARNAVIDKFLKGNQISERLKGKEPSADKIKYIMTNVQKLARSSREIAADKVVSKTVKLATKNYKGPYLDDQEVSQSD